LGFESHTDPMIAQLRATTHWVVQHAKHTPVQAYWVAGDFLRAVALMLLSWGRERIAQVQPQNDERWGVPERALRRWVLPEFAMRLQLLR
jgi:hypothetical protein